MSAPRFASVDHETCDLLSLIADDPRMESDYELFLDVCATVASAMGGVVYVNEVRSMLTDNNGDLTIHPRRLSAFWAKATGPGKPMRKTDDWQVCKGSGSGNDGRPQIVRRWVGEVA